MLYKTSNNKAFTLLELLVVISLIAILTLVILASLTDARTQSQATTMVVQLREIEKAFIAYQIGENVNLVEIRSKSYANNHQNYMSYIIANQSFFPNFQVYLQGSPVNFAGTPYEYYNRGGEYVECASMSAPSHETAYAIRIEVLDDAIFRHMDEIIDGEYNPTCGKLKKLGTSQSVYYDMSRQ